MMRFITIGILPTAPVTFGVIRPETNRQFKLAATDLDGTLLDSKHEISEANVMAVQRLQAAGVQVVLASGRHYSSMKKYADALHGVQWIVSCQGGEVSDASRATVLDRKFLTADDVRKTLETGRSLGFATVAYAIEGVFTDSNSNAEMGFYTDLAGLRPGQISTDELLAKSIFKVIWMGEPTALSRLPLAEVAVPPVQAVRTNLRFLEFMPVEATKGSALAILTARLGIPTSSVVVFGDGENDIPMFEWAGVSVAMPHGSPLAKDKATFTAPPGPEETAFARAVELVLKPAGF